MLAANGYAVLQVNYRGSSGYGSDFLEAGLRKWGSDIQRDIVEATRWTIRERGLDPKRVCIFGASFGGYSALQAPLVAPGLYVPTQIIAVIAIANPATMTFVFIKFPRVQTVVFLSARMIRPLPS